MSSTALNDFNLVASILGIIGIVPLFYMVIICQLPIAKYQALEDALSETRDYFVFVVEEGLMPDEDTTIRLGEEHDGYQVRAAGLKMEVDRDDGYLSQLRGMVSGLSYRIYTTYREVRKLRSKISDTSYTNKNKRRVGVRSILPALRQAFAGVVDDDDAKKLDDVVDSSQEAQTASRDESDITHDTREPPAYCATLEITSSIVQYTEALRTNDGEAATTVAAALDRSHTAQ
ncbi:hypothetical protein C8Q72DRAFT_948600 [Fomitopsis betulina]|nr:hypothetical protein C8Q72DRAFT_948600 [Fomitopsis betulina]